MSEIPQCPPVLDTGASFPLLANALGKAPQCRYRGYLKSMTHTAPRKVLYF